MHIIFLLFHKQCMFFILLLNIWRPCFLSDLIFYFIICQKYFPSFDYCTLRFLFTLFNNVIVNFRPSSLVVGPYSNVLTSSKIRYPYLASMLFSFLIHETTMPDKLQPHFIHFFFTLSCLYSDY